MKFETKTDESTEAFVARLRRVPRILAGHNRRMGSPLDEHDLADLSQDTAVIILQKRHLFAEGVPYESWVYRVCAMEIRNSVRRKRRRASVAAMTTVDCFDSTSPVDGSMAEVFADRLLVRDVLSRLEPDEAALIRAKHFEDRTFDEIAARAEVASSTLKTRYYRALSRLQILLLAAQRE